MYSVSNWAGIIEKRERSSREKKYETKKWRKNYKAVKRREIMKRIEERKEKLGKKRGDGKELMSRVHREDNWDKIRDE